MKRVVIGSRRKTIDEERDGRIHSIDNKILLVILRYMLMRDALQEAWTRTTTLAGAKIASDKVTATQ